MKTRTRTLLAISIGLIFTLSSCEILNIFEKPSNEPELIQLNKKNLEIIEADQIFAFELFHQVCSLSTEENIMISPLSASYALGMTYNGAAGTTQDAFSEVLHFDDLTKLEVNESYKDLMGQLVTLDDKVQFSIANSIWHVDWAVLIQEFVDLNKEYFDARVAGIDFSDPASVDTINNWIEKKTNNKIQDMLDNIPADAYMYLVNAIYFNATWKYEFDEENTFEGDFYLADGSTEKVDYMNMEADLESLSTEDYTAVELPYGDGAFSMVAMVPAYDNDVDDLLEIFTEDLWTDYNAKKEVVEAVTVQLPKFKYEFKDLLNDPLKNLGLGVAFDGDADFSNMTNQVDLFISRVIHQTFIDVNEKGTEAAAATIVEMRWESAVGNSFIADKPFLYIIKENSTGAIMFMGKVGRPEYE